VHDLLAGRLDVPVELDARRLEHAPGRLGQFGAGPVARDESHAVRHSAADRTQELGAPSRGKRPTRLRGQLEPAAKLYRAAEVLQEVHFQVPRKGVKLVQKHVDFISVMSVVLAVSRLCAKFEGVDFGFSSGR
jgi:hypothetical protein